MNWLFLALAVIFITFGLFITLTPKTGSVDENTMILCKRYAETDHQLEFAPARWAHDKDWIQKYDWYNSCLEHIRHPVAGN